MNLEKENPDILISGGTVLTMNPKEEIISDGAVVIKDDKIVFVGSKDEADSYFKTGRKHLKGSSATEIINAKGAVIMPGLINAHTHAAMSLFRGYADDLPLRDWLEKKIWPLETKLTKKDVYWGTKLAILEMIKSGTTCFNDMYWSEEASVDSAGETGIRAMIGLVLMDFLPMGGKENIEKYWNIFKDKKFKTISFSIAPHSIYTVSSENLIWAKDFAKKNNLIFHIHLSETEKEVEDCIKKYRKRPVEYLDGLEILDEKFVGAHGIWLNPNEIEILKKRKAKIVHCPKSNMKLASGVARVAKMLGENITVGLGTDSAASNNNLDMFSEMDFSAKLAKVYEKNPEVLKAEEVIKMATINGARALSLGKLIGSLEAGKKADIIIIDFQKPHLIPIYNNIYSHLVHSACGADVKDVIIDGRVVMRDRKVLSVDEEEVFQRVKEIVNKIKIN